MSTEKQTESVLDSSSARDSSSEVKRSPHGIVLVPQPSDDSADPLNWPRWKKILTLGIFSLAGFIGISQALAAQSGVAVQGKVYGKTLVQMSDGTSAAIAGLASGPLVWAPLSQRIGRSSVIFWGLILTLACCVWSAEMTSSDDYIPFVISRWLGGTFGSAPSTIGSQAIIDLFFLHNRGKAFSCYTLATIFGTQFGPTIGGFILQNNPWPVQFWWTVAVEGALIIVIFFFLEETNYRRDSDPPKPQSFIANRLATFFPGTKVAAQRGSERNSPFSAILIGICPVTLLAGGFLMIAFGWAVAVTTLLSVFLQTPVEEGGYSFTPLQVAAFTFAQWVGIALAYVYGLLMNDRVALWSCKRNGGIWKPEYRLFPMLLPPAIILPAFLGLFGAGLQYHLHYMVLALAVFLINFCEIAIVPLTINYVVECFTDHAAEVTTMLNFDRLILGLFVPFFIDGWEARVGPGWVFGMMAFFTIFAFLLAFTLVWKGPTIRQYSFARFKKSEDGVNLKVDEVSKENVSKA